ncbi:MAG: nucleoid occlusion protein [Ruminococcaceae bacterium]|nr:nucleoid occlusion protein [Oscillospiraceae bacterium]
MILPIQLTSNTPKTKSVMYIPIHAIRPNPYQPRRHFDQKALEELCISIKSFGILQPICVRRQTSTIYELVSGERRLRAAKMAGLESVPVIISEFDESDSALVALLENLQREDLSYMEEAQGYFHLINQHHLTQEEVALKVGKNQSTIANKLRILKLGPLVKKILTDNNLTERHARALLRLDDEQTQLSILKQVCEGSLNVSQTEKLIEQHLKNENEPKKQKKKNFLMGNQSVKLIINTIRQSIKMIRDAGMDASMREIDGDEFIEYSIKIKKPVEKTV